MPRSSFILLVGEGGTGKSTFMLHLLVERVKVGEPAVYVCFDDSPHSVLKVAEYLGFPLDDYLEKGQLVFIDCFSFRSPRALQRNKAVGIETIDDPRNFQKLNGTLLSILDTRNMEGRGAVFIDSLTELVSLYEASFAIEAIKIWRTEISKVRNVPVFAVCHVGGKIMEEMLDVLSYNADGIIDFRYDPALASQGYLVKQLRVRKMKGAPHKTSWHHFSVLKGKIIVPLEIAPRAHQSPFISDSY